MIVVALDGTEYRLRDGKWLGLPGRTLKLLESTRDLWQLDMPEGTGPGVLPTQRDRDRAWAKWVVRHYGGALVHESPLPPHAPERPGVVY
jgi:hypothetical protein